MVSRALGSFLATSIVYSPPLKSVGDLSVRKVHPNVSEILLLTLKRLT
jgi:hypothetical protein